MTSFLFTWNPHRWRDPEHWMEMAVESTAKGGYVEGRWSTGSRTHGFELGDRVFLLKQGVEPRGIVGSGWVANDVGVYVAEHYDPDKQGQLANYVDVDWEIMLPRDDPLPVEELRAATPGTNWIPQGSGQLLDDLDAEIIEELWAAHTARFGTQVPLFIKAPKKAAGAGWQRDPVRRKKVEDFAQAWLEREYREKQWTVKDTRYGNPFDAVASKGDQVLYLEAKGTETDGISVEVTIGEVNHAKNHPGQCVLGIVSGIRFLANGEVDPDTGELTIHEAWDPESGSLRPSRFRWSAE